MHQPKLQDELNFLTPINTPALFESITIYVSNLEYLAVMGSNAFMADTFNQSHQKLRAYEPKKGKFEAIA